MNKETRADLENANIILREFREPSLDGETDGELMEKIVRRLGKLREAVKTREYLDIGLNCDLLEKMLSELNHNRHVSPESLNSQENGDEGFSGALSQGEIQVFNEIGEKDLTTKTLQTMVKVHGA